MENEPDNGILLKQFIRQEEVLPSSLGSLSLSLLRDLIECVTQRGCQVRSGGRACVRACEDRSLGVPCGPEPPGRSSSLHSALRARNSHSE